MKLIVGLGNPGIEYAMTRHNIGFMCVDHIVKVNDLGDFKEGFEGLYLKTKINSEDFIFYKPTTYMNDSGRGLIQIVQFFKISLEDIVIISDDLDLPTGSVRIRKKSSSGGHNGLKSIFQYLGTEEIKRIRVGIDKSKATNIINYVLGSLTEEEKPLIKEALEIVNKAIIEYSKSSFDIVMSKYNSKNEK